MLGGYLSKQYDDCLISNAMIVSAPMNIHESCHEMEKTQYLFTFNRFLTHQIRKYLNKHLHWFEKDENYDCTAIQRVWLILWFNLE